MATEHRARKRFGQNFLHDQNIILKIVACILPQPNDYIVEIGPGQGALTRAILPHVNHMTAIEIDRDLIPILNNKFESIKKLTLIEADALAFDFASLKQNRKMRLVGNLPYNISTPLLFHLMQYRELIQDMHFMLQKEVVVRICAAPNTKDYGRLSVMIQYYCRPEYLFTVAPQCFNPVPKVDSAIICLTPHKTLPFTAKDEALLEKIVAAAFNQRRKTIRNSLSELITETTLKSLGIDPQARAENLTVENFVAISNHCSV